MRWINLYSRWDIISGKLEFYDLPKLSRANQVDNREDLEATTFLAAHTEYWKNPKLFEILHQTFLP